MILTYGFREARAIQDSGTIVRIFTHLWVNPLCTSTRSLPVILPPRRHVRRSTIHYLDLQVKPHLLPRCSTHPYARNVLPVHHAFGGICGPMHMA